MHALFIILILWPVSKNIDLVSTQKSHLIRPGIK